MSDTRDLMAELEYAIHTNELQTARVVELERQLNAMSEKKEEMRQQLANMTDHRDRLIACKRELLESILHLVAAL